MISRRVLVVLVSAALALPIVSLILSAVGQLLAAMQDPAGALVLRRLSLAAGVIWLLVLIALVIVEALDRLGPPPGPPLPPPEEPLE